MYELPGTPVLPIFSLPVLCHLHCACAFHSLTTRLKKRTGASISSRDMGVQSGNWSAMLASVCLLQ